MSMYKETRGPNWGAALAAIGSGLGDYAEIKRREMAMKMLRERQQADLADQRLYNQGILDRANARQDEENRRKYGPVIPAPEMGGIDFSAPGIGAASTVAAIPPNDTFDFMGVPLSRTENQGRYASEALADHIKLNPKYRPASPYEQFVVVGRDGQEQVYNAPGGRVPSAVAALETPDYSPTPAGVDEQGRNVYVLDKNYKAPTGGQRAPTPSEERLAQSELQKRIAAAVEGDIGNPATLLREMEIRDPKTNKITGSYQADTPSRGGGQFINHEDFSYFENPEAAGNAYAGSLADSVANRGITTYDQLPGGVVPLDMRRNAWENVVQSQPTVADMDFTLPLIADMKEPGWKFDNRGTADPLDDQFVKKQKWAQDDEMPVTDFMRTMVTPKADAEGRIEFKAFDAMFKKQYGVKYSDLIKGTAPEGF